jgi:hypothetical protein
MMKFLDTELFDNKNWILIYPLMHELLIVIINSSIKERIELATLLVIFNTPLLSNVKIYVKMKKNLILDLALPFLEHRSLFGRLMHTREL